MSKKILQGVDFSIIWAEYRYMWNKFTLTILLMMSTSSGNNCGKLLIRYFQMA